MVRVINAKLTLKDSPKFDEVGKNREGKMVKTPVTDPVTGILEVGKYKKELRGIDQAHVTVLLLNQLLVDVEVVLNEPEAKK